MAPLLLQDLQRLVGRFGAREIVFVAKDAGERVEIERVVIDDEQAVAHGPPIVYDAPMSRIDALRKFVEQTPNDPFPRYGLAMELKNLGQHDDAHAAFDELEQRHPDYVPQYLMHANLLGAMQRKADARTCLERDIAAAQKKRDAHALGELQGALAELDDE